MNNLPPLLVAGFGSDTAVPIRVSEPRVITHNPTDVDPLLPPSNFQSNTNLTNNRSSEGTVPEALWHLVPHRDEGGYATANNNQTSTINWSTPEVVTRASIDHPIVSGEPDYTFI